MSLLLTHSLADATAMMRGEAAAPGRIARFDSGDMVAHRMLGIEPAPGAAAQPADMMWKSVVRAWWGHGLTWGLCVCPIDGEVRWNLVYPSGQPLFVDVIGGAFVTGARFDQPHDFSHLTTRLRSLPIQAAMAGHPATGSTARLEMAVRAMIDRNFLVLILAKAVPRPEIEEQVSRLSQDEQFLRDEHLSRPGLEQNNHSESTRYLDLIKAAAERANTAIQEGGWESRILLAAENEADFRQAQMLIHSAFAGDGGRPEPLRWQSVADPRALTFLRSTELAALTRPPQQELPGFFVTQKGGMGVSRERTANPIFATATPSAITGPSIAVGRILDDGGFPRQWLDLSTTDLCRHLLIAGIPGSGKTVSCEHLILELWREHRIPTFVLEPGIKTGYRRLANSEIGSDLDIWAVGVPRTRRLPLNPMAAIPGITVAEHSSALFSIISSAFELVPPMPEVLASAIEETYRRHGWNLSGYVPNGPAPMLSDLIREIDRSTQALGYGTEIKGNIRAGLLLRLQRLASGPLAPEFTKPGGLDVEQLVKRPTLIELSAVPDAASQALVSGLILLQLRHYWKRAGLSDALRHVMVIEEAHRLLRQLPETAANSARNRATEDIANMLAEMRGFGAGLVIVDQTPSALVSSVIANTGTKLLHRMDHPTDRDLAGRAAGLPVDSVDLLGTLRPGEAILRIDSRPRPYRLRMPNPSVTYASKPAPVLQEIEEDIPTSGCPICGKAACRAENEGARAASLKARITAMQASLRKSTEAAWEWATQELRRSGIDQLPSNAPLCFLFSIGRSAGLSPSTLQRLRGAFASR